jgi:hypothetical protein
MPQATKSWPSYDEINSNWLKVDAQAMPSKLQYPSSASMQPSNNLALNLEKVVLAKERESREERNCPSEVKGRKTRCTHSSQGNLFRDLIGSDTCWILQMRKTKKCFQNILLPSRIKDQVHMTALAAKTDTRTKIFACVVNLSSHIVCCFFW